MDSATIMRWPLVFAILTRPGFLTLTKARACWGSSCSSSGASVSWESDHAFKASEACWYRFQRCTASWYREHKERSWPLVSSQADSAAATLASTRCRTSGAHDDVKGSAEARKSPKSSSRWPNDPQRFCGHGHHKNIFFYFVSSILHTNLHGNSFFDIHCMPSFPDRFPSLSLYLKKNIQLNCRKMSLKN